MGAIRIERTYHDGYGRAHEVPERTLEALRRAIGPASDRPRPLVVRRGEAREVGPCLLRLEDGTSLDVADRLPRDLPLGYHRLAEEHGERRLIVSPGRCHLPDAIRAWGWAVQVYAARSRESWGMGDLADLRRLSTWSRSLGAGMLLASPMLAVAPTPRQQPSPYYPATRRFLNPIYIRVEEVAGADAAAETVQACAAAGRALDEQPRIDRDAVWGLKLRALEAVWAARPPTGAFDEWRRGMGAPLEEFALWCVLVEEHGGDWRTWPADVRRPGAAGALRAREERADRVRFHQWLQWVARTQLERAGMGLVLIQDLPIGFDRGGADAWAWQDLLALDVSVGAPPDEFNARGQDWGLPPFIPHRLAEAGYEPFIQSVRAGLYAGGGLRIDHVMGLFRQFWIPEGSAPADGAYVRYPSAELLDILALESHRAGALVVGEDLGTVEPAVREEMAQRAILSYRVLWFEPGEPSRWPELSMASVTTHDLPTIAGMWTGADLEEQRSLGLEPNEVSARRIRRELAARLELGEDTATDQVVVAIHRRLAEAPSRLLCATLEDAALAERRPNLPGADGVRANWSLALPRPVEELSDDPVVRAVAEVFDSAVRAGGREEPAHGRP